ncbi:CBS domain containing protein, variant 2 [Balamuthia mandrillaris]
MGGNNALASPGDMTRFTVWIALGAFVAGTLFGGALSFAFLGAPATETAVGPTSNDLYMEALNRKQKADEKQRKSKHRKRAASINTRYVSSLKRLFAETRIAELVPERRLIVLEANDTIDHCLMTLQDNSILAVPIVDLTQNKYLGMVSALDLAAYLASLFPHGEEFPEHLPNKPLKTVVNFSQADPFLPQRMDAPMSDLMALFSQGIHRVPLKDEDGNVCNIVSQTDVLVFLWKNIDLLGGTLKASKAYASYVIPFDCPLSFYLSCYLFSLSLVLIFSFSILSQNSVQSFGLVPTDEKVPFVSKTCRVADALPLLYGSKALAVMDTTKGVLVGDFSAPDLRNLSVHNFKRIYDPVYSMCDKECVKVSASATLDTVVSKLVHHHKHRAWVVDEQGKPLSQINITDIIRILIE